jgi:hypothetical protein
MALPEPDGGALFMPAYLPECERVGLKTVTLFQRNSSKGLPEIGSLLPLRFAQLLTRAETSREALAPRIAAKDREMQAPTTSPHPERPPEARKMSWGSQPSVVPHDSMLVSPSSVS